jgi:hypothetical protein
MDEIFSQKVYALLKKGNSVSDQDFRLQAVTPGMD